MEIIHELEIYEQAGFTAAQALAAARQHACSRIWVVRTHLSAQEKLAWRVALRQQKVTLARAGRAGLGVIQVGGPGCR